MFNGFFFGYFCDEYVNEGWLSNLLFLVENGLCVYLFRIFFVIRCIFKLSEGVGVEVKLDNSLYVIISVLDE